MTLQAADASARTDRVDALTFEIGGETLAIDTRILREVLEPVMVTRCPGASAFVGGLINVRGAVVPLADLRIVFGMEQRPRDEETRILVVDPVVEGRAMSVAFIAEAVREVTRIDMARLEPVPVLGTRWRPRHVRGLVRRDGGAVMMLPEIETILADHLIGDPSH